ncbi:uncharacterized protein LOC119070138 isoform X1 [Bradysia coprophila]|uniref:uncharacterized protein LOC119070138 isoform X1 n=1 Tax=Bradysia coprophila TaxID=38358 RepID=UPI00187DC6D6|nr:uncharacterized protein LOC119070138 isoform X1 [Bradysia coprophila]XP_037030357.1 uncharacterized protein LOC119070138 isoform X1 [Bradysia coprophila]
MTSLDIEIKCTTFWLMFELIATLAFITFVIGYVILGRHLHRKCIKGSTVLITNGNSQLSQEIARQMINNHQCKVILVFEPDAHIPKTDDKCVSFERIYQCNFLDHNQVRELRDNILRNDGTIDILIENGKMPTTSNATISIFSFPPERFIEETSNRIIITLNLLINFIPSLKHSARRGHFVSIQSEPSGARPFLETSAEMKELCRRLSIDNDNLKPSIPNELCLSTVVFNDNKSDNKLFRKLELNLCEIAGTIIKGIQSEKKVVVVSERRSLINYLLKLIKFKCS